MTAATEDPILLGVLTLLADHLPAERVDSHRLTIRGGTRDLTLVAKSDSHHGTRNAGFNLYYDDSEAHFYFLLTQVGWPDRFAEVLGEEFGVRLDLERVTTAGEALGESLARWSDCWLAENNIISLVFNKLATALPAFEWGDYGSLNYEGQEFSIQLDQVYGDGDSIDVRVWGRHPRADHPREGRCTFVLSDQDCFQKLADVLGDCGIALDVEALA